MVHGEDFGGTTLPMANFSNSKVEYLIQFDFDLHQLTVDLNRPSFRVDA